MIRRSIAELNERNRRSWGFYGGEYVAADDDGIPLVRSLALSRYQDGSCLTHRARYVHHGVLNDGSTYESITTECGMLFRRGRVDVINPADELFLCHACHAQCEKHGIDHFNLVPNRGCESSGGRLGMNRKASA